MMAPDIKGNEDDDTEEEEAELPKGVVTTAK